MLLNAGIVAGSAVSGGAYDTDAQAYITAVEAADGNALETAIKDAINNFVVGCKTDGIWTAIKASCLLCGPRTLAGALVPLVGAAPTNTGTPFTAGNYNRIRLQGTGSAYLDTNRNNNADPQNSKHLAVWVEEVSESQNWIGTNGTSGSTSWVTSGGTGGANVAARANQSSTSTYNGVGQSTGLKGVTRASSSSITARSSSANQSFSISSGTPSNENINVFKVAGAVVTSGGGISFYSAGENLDLALLDTRIATYVSAVKAALI